MSIQPAIIEGAEMRRRVPVIIEMITFCYATYIREQDIYRHMLMVARDDVVIIEH